MTAIAMVLVDRTIHVSAALVTQILADRTLEKAFATLARDHAVVTSRGLVLNGGKMKGEESVLALFAHTVG